VEARLPDLPPLFACVPALSRHVAEAGVGAGRQEMQIELVYPEA